MTVKAISSHPRYRDHEQEPDAAEVALTLAKALGHQRQRHATDPAHAQAMATVALPPWKSRDGWWCVGQVIDPREEATWTVWYRPGPGSGKTCRHIGLTRQGV